MLVGILLILAANGAMWLLMRLCYAIDDWTATRARAARHAAYDAALPADWRAHSGELDAVYNSSGIYIEDLESAPASAEMGVVTS